MHNSLSHFTIRALQGFPVFSEFSEERNWHGTIHDADRVR